MTPAWKLVTSQTTKKKVWQRTAHICALDKLPNKEVLITCHGRRPIDYFEDPENTHLYAKSRSVPPDLNLTGLQYLLYFLDHPDERTANQAEFNLSYYLDPERSSPILNRLVNSTQEWRHLSPMIEDYISSKTRRARLLTSDQISLKTWQDYIELYQEALNKGYKRQKKFAKEYFCLDHFTRFREYLKYSTFFGRHGDKFTYYGCRKCKNTMNSIRIKDVIAVLDNAMLETSNLSHNSLSINWLHYRKPFDFNVVEIGACTEDDIANFCIYIGNDTDIHRSRTYSTVKVRVKEGVYLSSQSEAQLSRFFKL